VQARAVHGDDRNSRYQAAQAHPLVKDLVRRFEADIVSREVVTREEWIKRFDEPEVPRRIDDEPERPIDPDA
nr:hypothetical protein [Planctomycetota bacterium]